MKAYPLLCFSLLALWLAACQSGGDDDAGLTGDAQDVPDGALPDGALPDGALPDGALPDGALPDGALPDGDASRPDPETLSAHPELLELPAEAPYLIGHPLIFDGRLYLRSTDQPGFGVGRQVLTCYDLRDGRRVLWSTVLGEQLYNLTLLENTVDGVALIRSDDSLPIHVLELDLEAGDLHHRFLRVHAISGEVELSTLIPDHWTGINARGNLQRTSVQAPQGSPVEHGGELYYSDGTMLNSCSGSVVWSNGNWRLTSNDAIVVGDRLYGYVAGGSSRVVAIDVTQARAEILGFVDDVARLFETEPGDSAIAQPGTSGPRDFILYRGHILKFREREGLEGVEDGYYLERSDAQDGHFVDRVKVPFQQAQLAGDTWHELMVAGYPVIVDGILLFPAMHLENLMPAGGALFAFDLDEMRFMWRATWPGGVNPHTTIVPSRDAVYVVERRQHEDSPHADLGFQVHRLDLRTGARTATFQDPETYHYTAGGVGALAFEKPDGEDAMAPEAQPLLYGGKLYLTATGVQGSVIWVLDVGDPTANVLQYKLNNQLNAVLNVRKPESNQAEDPIPAVEPPPETETETAVTEPLEGDDSLDTLPGLEPYAPALAALELSAEDLAALPRAFIATLGELEFSQSGEESATNEGEGFVWLRTRYGCDKAKLRYPWKGFLGLLGAHPFQPNAATWLSFEPQLPVFYRPESWLDGANSALNLGWSALEDDAESGLDRLFSAVGDLVGMVRSYLSGDYCGLAQQIASAVAAEANDHTQHFGAPFLTLFGGSGEVPPNVYGLPLDQDTASLPISGSGTRGVLVAAADAIGAACAIGSVASNPTQIGNAVSSTLEAFSPEDRSTRGRFDLRRARFLKLRELTVTLDRVELPTPVVYHLRAGLIGEDPLSSAPDGAVSPYDTPFISYIKREDLTAAVNQDLNALLLRYPFATSEDTPGTAALYLELDLATIDPLHPGHAVLSETRFLEDLLFGAWEQTPGSSDRFQKTVRRRVDTPTLQGYVQLTYRLRTR